MKTSGYLKAPISSILIDIEYLKCSVIIITAFYLIFLVKDCAANGEIPSFAQLEASFGLSGVVSLYFFSVFLFLTTLTLFILTLVRLASLYRNAGQAEVSSQSE